MFSNFVILLNLQINFVDASSQLASPELASPISPHSPLSTTTTTNAEIIPDLWPELAEKYGDSLALLDPHASPPAQYTFTELSDTISTLARGLSSLGLTINDHVSLISENSSRWLIADQAIQRCGAVDAVRGISSTVEELSYIMQHSNSNALFVQDMATLKYLAPVLSTAPLATSIRFVVVLWDEFEEDTVPMPVYSFNQVLEQGKHQQNDPPSTTGDALATLVYTSGTTGSPKGVQLTHSNLLYQVKQFPAFLNVLPGSRTLSILPAWHVYERSVCYHVLSRGTCQVYSGIRYFRDDLTAYPPDHLVCVPLVLDTLRSRVMATLKKEKSVIKRFLALNLLSAAIAYTQAQRIVHGVAVEYAMRAAPAMVLFKAWIVSIFFKPLNWLAQKLVTSKIRTALGVKKCVVSGGGSLAPHLDDFFEAVGLPVLNGYGLTETSPVLACRAMDLSSFNTAATATATPTATTATTSTSNSTTTTISTSNSTTNSTSSSTIPSTTISTTENANLNGANVRGSVGRPIPETQIKIVNPENLQESYPNGTQGLILVRGPGVMQGYYNNESATAAAFSAGEGWFNTGDLGWIVPSSSAGTATADGTISSNSTNSSTISINNKMAGCLVLTGRAKDTIVLSSGENVEPQPIEDALCASPFIKFAALVGQGHRTLGALLVLDTEALTDYAKSTLKKESGEVTSSEIDKLMKEAVTSACAQRVRWEHVAAWKVLEKPFSVEDGTLTKTMKPRRAVIHEVYKNEIAALEAKLR